MVFNWRWYLNWEFWPFWWAIHFFWVSHESVSSVARLHPTLCEPKDCNTRLPCPTPTPGDFSNSCLSSRWCHPTISSSVVPFPSCLPSFPASGSVLHIRWPKYWSFSFSISPSNSGLISFRILNPKSGLISCCPRDSQECSPNHSSKTSILWHLTFFMVQLSHPYMITGKIIALTIQTFAGKVTSLFFNMLSRFVITFLPGSKQVWHVSSPCTHVIKLLFAFLLLIYLILILRPV